MKVLLIISGEPKYNPQHLNLSEKRFPIGVGYLISVLKKRKIKVDFLDRYLLGNIWPKKWDYELVGIYSSTPTFPDTLKIIEKVPSNIPIAVGGPHTVFSPDTIPDKVKWICQGEGELMIQDIVDNKLKAGIYKYERIKNLDYLPTPAFDYFDPLPYIKSVKWFPGKTINFVTSRGCPYNCSFCWVRKIWGRKVTVMSAERIIEDILKVKKDYNVEGIYFREDNFTVLPDRVEKFCNILNKKNIKINWCCEGRANTPLDLLPEMAKSGCRAIYVGIESGSDKMLEVFNKQLTIAQIESFLSKCRKVGIKIAASFIVNHPEETESDKLETKKLIEKWKPDTIWLNPWREDYVIPKN